jgi:pilus assembly protein CpaE
VINLDPLTAPLAIVVVDDDPDLRGHLAEQVGAPADSTFANLEALEDNMTSAEPVLVVVGPSYADSVGLARVERFLRDQRQAATLLVVENLSTETLQQALRAGVRDVVAEGDHAQLREAVGRVAGSLARRAPASAPPAMPALPTTLGEVITVFSTKGGAGKSVVASNLALVLARNAKRPVVLVDADLQFGDLAVMLKLTPQHTLVDAVGSINRLDQQLLQSLLVPHPSGLLVLCAPLEPAFADQVSAANLVRVVQLLRTFASFVVIDTPAQFNEVVLAMLEESDHIVLVAGMDIPNIKNVKLGLQTLRLLNVPVTKLKLVLNRANSKVRLDVGEVERTLGIKADCLVPSDIVVPQSVNKGVPAVIDAPRSKVSKSFEQLAGMFAHSEASATSRS